LRGRGPPAIPRPGSRPARRPGSRTGPGRPDCGFCGPFTGRFPGRPDPRFPGGLPG